MTGQQPTAYIARANIALDGRHNDEVSGDAIAAFVEETIDGLYRCEITLTNYGAANGRGDYTYFGRDKVDFGKEITLTLGYGTPSPVFAGRITALEADYHAGGGPRLRILAEDRLQDFRMSRRTRSYEDVTDADVIELIARKHQLTPDISLNGAQHKTLAQLNLSDLAFIRERARACGGEVWVSDSTLHVKPRTERGGSPVNLSYGLSLIEFSVRADLAQQCTEFNVHGWSVADKREIVGTAEAGALAAELNNLTGGGAILQQKFGARPATLVHTVPLTPDEATKQAEARYRERARQFVTGAGIADGSPEIRVGVTVNLSRLGDLFDGAYYVTRVRHTFTLERGYLTEFAVERPGIGQA